MSDSAPPSRLRFGPFVLDKRRAELRRDGKVLALRPKPFALLSTLVERPEQVLSKDELMAAVWPGLVVTDDSLTQAVHELRAVLGPEGPQLLRTVPRRGYRFDAQPVDADTATAEAPAPAPAADAPSVGAAPVATAGAGRPRHLAAAAVVVAGLFLMVHLGAVVAGAWPLLPPAWSQRLGLPAAAPASGAPRLSLVVLPLQSEADSDGGAAFSEPLTADLITDLGRLSGATVISRETAFSYRGQTVDPRQVARELDVRWVVQGSVRRRLDEARLHLTLIDGASGRQAWADQFRLDRSDLRQSLERVTGTVSRALGVAVYAAEARRAAALSAGQVEADDLAMQGWASFYRGITRANVFEALRLFEAAVARDPDTLRAWSGIGLMTATALTNGWLTDPAAAFARIDEALRQAERLDPDDMLTQTMRGSRFRRSGDYAGLLQHTTALVERFPNSPFAHMDHADALMQQGRFDDCAEPARKALRLGPRDSSVSVWRTVLSTCHFLGGRYVDAANEARLAVQAQPGRGPPHFMLAAALQRSGQLAEAQQAFQEGLARTPYREDILRNWLASSEPGLAGGRERLLSTFAELRTD